MQLHKHTHDEQPQAHAFFIKATGFIRFIKPLEDFPQVSPGDSLTAVADGKVHPAIFFPDGDGDIAALVGKFNGIVHQIEDDLMNPVRIRFHTDFRQVFQAAHLNAFVIDELFAGEKDAHDHIRQAEKRRVDFQLTRFHAGNVQHGTN